MSAGALIGSMVAGALVSSLFGNRNQNADYLNQSNPIAYTAPAVPKAPDALAAGEDNAAANAMQEAADKEKKEALARQQNNREIFTSPLGVVGQANTARRQLLGS